MSAEDIARANIAPREFQPNTPPRPGARTADEVSSPGSWSTAATPGTDDRTRGLAGFYDDNDTPTKPDYPKGGGSRLKKAWVSGELEGYSEDGADVSAPKRSVRFTPSTSGLTPPVDGGPTQPFSSAPEPRPSRPTPTSSDPTSISNHHRSSSLKMSSPPRRRLSLSSAQPKFGASTSVVSPPVASTPIIPQPSVPPALVYESAPPPSDPSPSQDLTPQLIARAQKHCRFAISALDYEDAEQARKELRAALIVLGG